MTTQPRRITIPYSPRSQQAAVHADPHRFKVLVSHRRFGKSVYAINELIKQASMCTRPQPRYAYLAPYLVQAKDIAWSYLKHYTAPIPGVKINEAETWIELPGDRRIRLYGADNADRLRGLYFDGVVLDEPAQMAPRVWAEIIRPALSDRLGWATFIGTPMGRNMFCDLYELGQSRTDPDWVSFMFKASETGIVPAAELDAARRSMTPDQYAQEFETSFDAAIPGAYYAELLSDLDNLGRIKPIAWEPNLPVHTAWDLGINDPTAIWFFQVVHGEIRCIDYYEQSGSSLEQHIFQLRAGHRAAWVYGMHLMPHDANVKELQTGMTRVQALKKLGVHPTVLPMLGVDDGISQARFVMRKCWFNSELCADGLKALRQYRSEWDEKRQVLKPTPLHDWTSHCLAGDTPVLIRNGSSCIMDLPQSGEVLTSCGWKPYRNPRVTRRNAPVVAVQFSDGLTVRCTPDHMFKTVNGWKSAASLRKGSLILSGSTRSLGISTAGSIDYSPASDTRRGAAQSFIATCGARLLAMCQRAATSIIETKICRTLRSQISSACQRSNISSWTPLTAATTPGQTQMLDRKRPSGIAARRGVSGTSAMPNGPRAGLSGSAKNCLASIAANPSCAWSARAAALRSSAPTRAKPLRIASVEPLPDLVDVWCLTVPDAEEFALSNGAIVHNCADAYRYLAVGVTKHLMQGMALADTSLSGAARGSSMLPRKAGGGIAGAGGKKPWGWR